MPLNLDTRRVRIATWNLNHRAKQKALHPQLTAAMAAINADVWALTEFVDGPSRAAFHESLLQLGLTGATITPKQKGANQVLLASKAPNLLGDISPPDFDIHAETNFIHCLLPSLGVEIVALRAPAYKLASDLKSYWKQVGAAITENRHRRIIFFGDLNCDPKISRFVGTRALNDLGLSGYQIPDPQGDWSYISHDGRKTSRLDHAIISPSITVASARYVDSIDKMVVAGPNALNPISDHAILIIEAGVRTIVSENLQQTSPDPSWPV